MKNFYLRIFALFLLLTVFVVSCVQEDEVSADQAVPFDQNVIKFKYDVIPGKYIVVFDDNFLNERYASPKKVGVPYAGQLQAMREVASQVLRAHKISASNIEKVYAASIRGIALPLSEAEVAALTADPAVKFIEQDHKVYKQGGPPFGGGGGGGCSPTTGDSNCDPTVHYTDSGETPWGITAVGGSVNYNGSNVAWIIDTGIDLNNGDLNIDQSRAFYASDMRGNDASPDDGDGHGTHVAGTVAAKANGTDVVGVAAGATVIPVKVLGKRGGSISGVIEGVDHVAANGTAGDVANMSLGGGFSQSLNTAVQNASSGGIMFAVAAGNDGSDASDYSPASASGNNVFTISAIDSRRNFASFSNWGAPVDFAAPGVSVKSLRVGGGTVTYSGTSMASPHAAGVLLATGGNPGNSGNIDCGDTCDSLDELVISR